MSIKLRFEKGSFVSTVTLKDEALPGLLALVSEHQSDEAVSPALTKSPHEDHFKLDDDASKDQPRFSFAQEWLAKHSASEVLRHVGWETYAEKVLLLGAHIEAKGGSEGWKASDVINKFSEAREQPPGNFARDISSAIKSGIVATVTPRTYRVSRTGWLRIYEALMNRHAQEVVGS